MGMLHGTRARREDQCITGAQVRRRMSRQLEPAWVANDKKR